MKRLVLLGGGHAHVAVLAEFARRPLPGWAVQLVTPYRRQIYSGMLPGWIAGHYPIESCAIALDGLAARARIGFVETSGQALDPVGKVLTCADGRELGFDILSIDTGPVASIARLPGAADHALPIRPIERFIAAWPRLADEIASHPVPYELVVLGSGAGGVELALAIQHRAQAQHWQRLHVSVVDHEALPVPGAPVAVRRRLRELMRERGIAFHGRRPVARVHAHALEFDDGARLDFDACLVATGAAAPAWPAAGGLATDASGFIRVGPTLQSLSHGHIFAAGDVASYHSARPKSGVYAVRAGPVLAANLRAACLGGTLQAWVPQRRALYLISTGDRRAYAIWGPLSLHGTWLWRWKDHIDRSFMRRFGTSA